MLMLSKRYTRREYKKKILLDPKLQFSHLSPLLSPPSFFLWPSSSSFSNDWCWSPTEIFWSIQGVYDAIQPLRAFRQTHQLLSKPKCGRFINIKSASMHSFGNQGYNSRCRRRAGEVFFFKRWRRGEGREKKALRSFKRGAHKLGKGWEWMEHFSFLFFSISRWKISRALFQVWYVSRLVGLLKNCFEIKC